jgi:hypothetical protein
MNSQQRIVLGLTILLTSVAFLVPPWKFVIDRPGRLYLEEPGPYAFIFAPPSVPITRPGVKPKEYKPTANIVFDELQREAAAVQPATPDTYNGYAIDSWSVRIDVDRLLVGLAGIAVVTGILVFTVSGPSH